MSLKAFHQNKKHLHNKTEIAIMIIVKSGHDGITATEYAKVIGTCCKYEASPALSRALKASENIFKQDDENETEGRYYSLDDFPIFMWYDILTDETTTYHHPIEKNELWGYVDDS